jgi:protease I
MALKDKNVVIYVENDYQELEFWYPLLRMREAGATTTITGPVANKIYRSKLGYPVTTQASAESLDAKKVDAVIIPGGYAPDHMRVNQPMLELVHTVFNQQKIVAAICHAAWVLISAGIVKDRQMTCYHTVKDDVVNAGGRYIDQVVVKDGNLITARQPDDLPQFCQAIVTALA